MTLRLPLLVLSTLAYGLLCWSPKSSFSHGGPPTTHDVLFVSGQLSLVTSHGLFAQERDWEWVCEEAISREKATRVVRTAHRWFVATITGLRASDDACHWMSIPALLDRNILGLAQDISDPDKVWAATEEGLWLIDGAEDPHLQKPMDFSVRRFGQAEDGRFLIVGYDDTVPIAQLDGQRILLPTETGRMEVLSVDKKGRFYMRFPSSQLDRLVRVSGAGAEVLLPVTDLIQDVVMVDDKLYVLYRDGISWSADDGMTWSSRRGTPIGCLRKTDDGFYACPPANEASAILFLNELAADPADWQWSSALNFDQVSKNSCDQQSTTRTMCDYLWPVVSEELGITRPEIKEQAAITSMPNESCGATAIPGVTMWLTLFGYRRAKSKRS